MRELLNNYYEAKQIDSFESLSDEVLQEHFLASLPPDVRKFVYSKQPETAAKCSEYADVCFQIKSTADCNDNGGGTYFGAMQGQAARPFYSGKGANFQKRENTATNGYGRVGPLASQFRAPQAQMHNNANKQAIGMGTSDWLVGRAAKQATVKRNVSSQIFRRHLASSVTNFTRQMSHAHRRRQEFTKRHRALTNQ